jgi:Trypsin-like peptidase domain
LQITLRIIYFRHRLPIRARSGPQPKASAFSVSMRPILAVYRALLNGPSILNLAGYQYSLSLLVTICLFTLGLRPSYADQQDETFQFYAVNIDMRAWRGNGIYIGKGLFVTAAHVVGRSWFTRPKIVIGSQIYPTRVVKEGSSGDTDLTLLGVEEALLPMRLQLRRNPFCSATPRPGQEVVTVTPEAVVHSHIIAPERLPPALRKFTSAIADVATTGNSGSGVFDVRQKCLLGIITQKISLPRANTGPIEAHDIAKYFIPASIIAAFMPAEFRVLTNQ